jgi:hypothetical protein
MGIPEFRDTKLLGLVIDFVSFSGRFTEKQMVMKTQSNKKAEADLTNKSVVTSSQLESGITRFANNFNSNINGGGLYSDRFQIDFDNGLPDLFTMVGLNHPGLIFEYGFNILDKSICYIMGIGDYDSQDKLSSLPFKVGINDVYYVLSKNSTQHEPVLVSNEARDLAPLRQAYLDHVIRRNPSSGILEPISANPNDNPKKVFHKKAELVAFYEEYKDLDNLNMYFYHGADSAMRHALGLRFGNDRAPFPINDVNYRLYGNRVRYRMKAFNIGQLCPPDCGRN